MMFAAPALAAPSVVTVTLDNQPQKPLQFVAADSKINEDAAGDLSEVSEPDPGKSGNPSMKLDPGTYMLLCNVAGHYMAGMWTIIAAH